MYSIFLVTVGRQDMEHGTDISLYTADELKMATVDPDVSADMIVFLYL